MAWSRENFNLNISALFQLERTHKAILKDTFFIFLGSMVLISLVVLGRFVPELSPYFFPLQIPLSLIFVLFIPGYLLQAILFPYRGDLDGMERVGLSLGLSVAVNAILALIIDRSPWEIGILSITFGQFWVISFLSALVLIRRIFTSKNLPYCPTLVSDLRSWWLFMRMVDWRKIAISILGILFIGLIVGLNLFQTSSSRFMTEFYILGAEGLAENYPRDVEVGEPVTLTAGINNLERDPATYSITIRANNNLLAKSEPVILQAGDEWQDQLVFVMPYLGENQPVEILLNRANYPAPYRALRIWLNVYPK
jgi:uncharacterized membrane protein